MGDTVSWGHEIFNEFVGMLKKLKPNPFFQNSPWAAEFFSTFIGQWRKLGFESSFLELSGPFLKYARKGISVLEENRWNTLIILDACRFDTFQKLNSLPGSLEKKISAGSDTAEWLIENFCGRELPDIVYISATPVVSHTIKRRFVNGYPFRIEKVWKNGGWSKKLNTTHPSAITDRAKKIREENPNKRLIVHYSQPHHTYIRSDGEKVLFTNGTTWEFIRKHGANPEEVYNAYEETFRFGFNYVLDLVEYLNERIIISADHGEAFGECGIYGHPFGVHIKPLIEIPWLRVT